MKIDPYEWGLAKELARRLGCSVDEAIALSIRTLYDVADSRVMIRSMRGMIAEVRSAKARVEAESTQVDSFKPSAAANVRPPKSDQTRRYAKPKGLTHNPFARLKK